MSCIKCAFVNIIFRVNTATSRASIQVEKCENCAYGKKSSKLKQSTYKVVRLNYIENFWKNSSKKT